MDYKYYNVSITNKETRIDKEASIHVRLAGTLLEKPEDYKMMIQKFSIDAESIPITIIELKNPQTVKTQNWETIHNVYVSDGNGNIASANVLFNNTRIPNNPPKPRKVEAGMGYYNNRDNYFFVYNYTHLLKMINNAIANAFSQLYPTELNIPKFVYDPISQLITIFYPQSIFSSSTPQPMIYFSLSLFKYIGEGFTGSIISTGAVPGINENIYTIEITNSSINTPQTDSTWITMPQTYKAITTFSTINAILIQSNTLPIRAEFFPSNYEGYSLSGSNSEENYTNMNAFPIISVFYPYSSDAGDFRGKIIYSNDSLRDGDLIDLRGTNNLNELHIGVYFTDNYNNIYPLRLLPGKTVNIRLAFIKTK